MNFPFRTEAATFLERPNRYRVVARLQRNGTLIHAHCPNPGRLGELLLPGATVHVSPATHQQRKTAYDLRFVEHPDNGQLVSLDTRLPNQLFAEGLTQKFFPQFAAYDAYKAEVSLPPINPLAASPVPEKASISQRVGKVHSRIDFQLTAADDTCCWVEVKSVSLVIDGSARFPDAVTARGRRHALELAALSTQGERAAIVFIVQRADAYEVRPQWETDPALGEALVTAQAAGVAIYAYTCAMTVTAARLAAGIPVHLDRAG